MTQDQENKIREEWNEKFKWDISYATEQEQGDRIADFFLTKMKEQIELAVRERDNELLRKAEQLEDIKGRIYLDVLLTDTNKK